MSAVDDGPRLSALAVRDILVIICEENGTTIDDLPSPVFSAAVDLLSQLARHVHSAHHLSA